MVLGPELYSIGLCLVLKALHWVSKASRWVYKTSRWVCKASRWHFRYRHVGIPNTSGIWARVCIFSIELGQAILADLRFKIVFFKNKPIIMMIRLLMKFGGFPQKREGGGGSIIPLLPPDLPLNEHLVLGLYSLDKLL